MRKNIFMLLTMLLLILFTACSDKEDGEESTASKETSESPTEENSDDLDETKEVLTLQLLKEDEENGETIEEHDIYSELDKIIKDSPNIGKKNDFSLFVVNSLYDQSGNAKILLLAVNRLPDSIKNLSFNYTLGTEDDEYVFESQHVIMDEETAGVLQPNSTFPLVLTITTEQDEILQKIDENNQVVKVEDFVFETYE